VVLSFVSSSLRAENVHMTQVFVLPIEPSMFNWTLHGNKILEFINNKKKRGQSPLAQYAQIGNLRDTGARLGCILALSQALNKYLSHLYFCFIVLRLFNMTHSDICFIQILPIFFLCDFSGVKSRDQYEYRPSQINSPDLPPWINYVYSPRHQLGFLYGVPPPMPQPTGLEVFTNHKNWIHTKITNIFSA